MAESSIFWTTDGTGDGTDTGYTPSQLFEFVRMLAASGTSNSGGVAPDYLNELEVTGTSTPVSVNTGAASVYGIPYFNSAAVEVAVPTPSGDTRIDYIVLRASWSAQTVRITRVAGEEGGAAPALTQSANTTWDVPLATASITTGGVITVTDAREWLTMVGDDDVTNAKLANMTRGTVKVGGTSNAPTDLDAKTSGQILVGDGTDIKSVAVSGDATLAASGALTIAADAVSNTKLANMTRGTVKVGGASDAPTDLDANDSGKILVGDGTDINSVAVSGDATLAANGALTIANDAVTYAKMQDVSATDKLLGRSTAGSGIIEEIACTAAGRALLDDAANSDQRTTLGLGTIATQAASSVAITGGTIAGTTMKGFIGAIEDITISATAATGTVNFDVVTQSVLYYTTAASDDWTLNIRGDGSTTLNSLMAIGESMTIAHLVTQSDPAYFNEAITIDGDSETIKWQGGAAASAGNVDAVDVYVYSIIKTGDAAFTVFVSQTGFA